VLLEQTHLKIRDCAIHEKNGRRWAQLPGRPMIDRDGVALRDEDGKTKYARILEFDTRERRATASREPSSRPYSRASRSPFRITPMMDDDVARALEVQRRLLEIANRFIGDSQAKKVDDGAMCLPARC
jgi:hypothetical protein